MGGLQLQDDVGKCLIRSIWYWIFFIKLCLSCENQEQFGWWAIGVSYAPFSFIHIYDVNMYNYYKVVCYFYKCWSSWIKILKDFHWDASKGSFDLFIWWVCSKDYDVIKTLNDHSTSITTVKFATIFFNF
jgi:hypothetical protein